MNYAKHYYTLIERARGRIVVGYSERHHILPRCMGGSNDLDNLVYLTGAEHFVAHQLLVKLYPSVRGLIFALNRMAQHCNNNKVYEWIKKRLAREAKNQQGHWLGKTMPESVRAKMSATRIGMRRSDEARAKMSLKMRGNQNAKGKKLPPRTAEHCKKISMGKMGIPSPFVGIKNSDRKKHQTRLAPGL